MTIRNSAIKILAIAAVIVAPAVPSASAADGHEHETSGPVRKAIATIAPRSASAVQGTATFTRKGDKVQLRLVLRNLKPGVHAVHLHETGDCSDPEAKSAGPHWNPSGAPHGKWGGKAHLGDIGNVEANEKGKATLKMTTEMWSLGGSAETNVLGRAFIVHASPDDFNTQPTGNAGGRVGCGVIREVR